MRTYAEVVKKAGPELVYFYPKQNKWSVTPPPLKMMPPAPFHKLQSPAAVKTLNGRLSPVSVTETGNLPKYVATGFLLIDFPYFT